MFERVRSVIIKHLAVSNIDIGPTTRLMEDLGADSLDVFAILVELSEVFQFDALPEDLSQVVTVGDLLSYIENTWKI